MILQKVIVVIFKKKKLKLKNCISNCIKDSFMMFLLKVVGKNLIRFVYDKCNLDFKILF